MIIFFQEIILLFIIWILKMIEGIMEIFNNVLEMDILNMQSEKENILEYLFLDSKLFTIFWNIFIFTIFLGALFTIISIIKNAIKNNCKISSIISKYVISLISTLIVLIITVMIIFISNSLLNMFISIFDYDLDFKLSEFIFNSSVNNWLNDYSIFEVDFSTITVDKLLGEYEYSFNMVYPSNWKNNGMIDPQTFLYLPSLVTSVIVLFSLIYSCINIIKRIYKIILLYITMPMFLSLIPLDDGNRFKLWSFEFIQEVILIFIVFFSINIFSLVMMIMTKISFSISISDYGKSIFNLLAVSGGAIFMIVSQVCMNKMLFKNTNIKPIIKNKIITRGYSI